MLTLYANLIMYVLLLIPELNFTLLVETVDCAAADKLIRPHIHRAVPEALPPVKIV